jgi:hypothetical protein
MRTIVISMLLAGCAADGAADAPRDERLVIGGTWHLRVRTVDCPTLERDVTIDVTPGAELEDPSVDADVFNGCGAYVRIDDAGMVTSGEVHCSTIDQPYPSMSLDLSDDGTDASARVTYWVDATGCESTSAVAVIVERVR